MRSRVRGRVDSNLKAIAELARKVGFLVYVRNDALADLDVQLGGRHQVWEVKNRKGKLTPRQIKVREQGWTIREVRTAEDVLAARAEITGDRHEHIQRANLVPHTRPLLHVR